MVLLTYTFRVVKANTATAATDTDTAAAKGVAAKAASNQERLRGIGSGIVTIAGNHRACQSVPSLIVRSVIISAAKPAQQKPGKSELIVEPQFNGNGAYDFETLSIATRIKVYMDAPRPYTGHFKQYAFMWRPAFSQRQTRLYNWEDERFDDQALDPATTTDELVDTFVNNRCLEDVDRYFYRSDSVGGFLKRANVQALRSNIPTDGVTTPKILIDDRNSESVTRTHVNGNCRPSQGPLNAHQFYRELIQERLPNARRIHPGPAPVIDAERRIIYITDLDPFCALTMAATASKVQAAFLRNFIHRHLVYRALIGGDIWSPSPRGASFALEFHLPYYAWRRTRSMVEDTREGPDQLPFRRSEEVIPLQLKGPVPAAKNLLHDYIYEAQLSVMVTGSDEWVWTAYCFADVYFKGDDHTERVQHYFNPDTKMDPTSCGRFPANPPVWIPRGYFLRALSCRTEQVKQEWNNSVHRLIQQIEPYIWTFTREDTDIGKDGDLGITRQKGFKWTIRVLRQFTHLLSKTIDAWETFKDGEIRYFYIPHSENLAEVAWGAYLASIDRDVTELRDLRSSLYYHTELFENMTNSLVTHAQHAETIITRFQSEFIQALTIITILYLPATLASTIFSMQNPIFSNPKLKDWIATLTALSLATIFLVLNLPHITKFGPPIRAWNDQMWAALYRIMVVNSGLSTQWTRVKAKSKRPDDAIVDDESEAGDEDDDGIELLRVEIDGEAPGVAGAADLGQAL